MQPNHHPNSPELSISHHPDDATLVSFSSGSLERSFAALVACHLHYCDRCRERLQQAEALGAELFGRIEAVTVSDSAKQQLMQRLETEPAEQAPTEASPEPLIPALLQDWRQADFDQLEWKLIAPGIRQFKLPAGDAHLNLLRIAPGTSVPVHGHEGSELTLILSGSYSDEIGRFQAGDVADLDDEIEHQPIADRNQDCICLIATDAPLRFRNWVPRLMQGLTFSFE